MVFHVSSGIHFHVARDLREINGILNTWIFSLLIAIEIFILFIITMLY